MLHINLNKDEYAQDMQIDMQTSDDGMLEYTKNVVDILERDVVTQAYSRGFIEDIITSELARSNRYKLELSFVILKLIKREDIDNTDGVGVIGEVITEHIRQNDYFGKLSENEYVIVTSNTSLGGAVILAEKISQRFATEVEVYATMDYFFGVTQAGESDSMDVILEKLQDALSRSMKNETKTIEIEV
jgi:CPA1 family monovalent cation:H+ antiporter